jgi:hypothetical protein
LAIADGKGGALSLDLATPNLDAFTAACRLIAKGPLPWGGTVLIVRLEPEVYVLSYSEAANGTPEVQIASLHDPLARIHLSPELAEVVATLIDEGARDQQVPQSTIGAEQSAAEQSAAEQSAAEQSAAEPDVSECALSAAQWVPCVSPVSRPSDLRQHRACDWRLL